MCFIIDYKAKKWKNKYVYKFLCFYSKSRGWAGPHSYMEGWKEGAVVKMKPGRTTDGVSAMAGIYVFKTREAAARSYRDYLSHPEWGVIVRLKVNPRDLLHISKYQRMATYKKVIVGRMPKRKV